MNFIELLIFKIYCYIEGKRETEYHFFYLSIPATLFKNKKPLISEWSVIAGAGLEPAASGL